MEIVPLNDNITGYVLTAFLVVIENVLRFLSARDLCSCALVCSTWNRIVRSVKSRRNNVYFIRMALEDEARFCDKLVKCWSEPSLVVLFGPLGIDVDVERDCLESLQNEEHLGSLIGKDSAVLSYVRVLQQAIISVNNVRKHLPRKCHLIRIPVTTFSKIVNTEVVFSVLSSLVIPSLPGVEMETFSIASTSSNINVDIELGDLYVPQQDRQNSLRSNVKCVLLFINGADDAEASGVDILTNSSLEKYVSSYTIISGGKISYLPISIGIIFGGEKIEIECLCLTGRECCMRSVLRGLQKLGLFKKKGVAFLLSTFVSQRIVCSLFQEFFPNILLLGIVCSDDGLLYPNISTKLSEKWCDVCGALLNTNHHSEPDVVIVCFSFQNLTYDIVNFDHIVDL